MDAEMLRLFVHAAVAFTVCGVCLCALACAARNQRAIKNPPPPSCDYH